MKIVEVDSKKYVQLKSGEQYGLNNIQDFLGLRDVVYNFHEFLQSMEGQAMVIIYEKYKRSYELDTSILKTISLAISKDRLTLGKTPNVDYITQKLSDYVKTYCREKILDGASES